MLSSYATNINILFKHISTDQIKLNQTILLIANSRSLSCGEWLVKLNQIAYGIYYVQELARHACCNSWLIVFIIWIPETYYTQNNNICFQKHLHYNYSFITRNYCHMHPPQNQHQNNLQLHSHLQPSAPNSLSQTIPPNTSLQNAEPILKSQEQSIHAPVPPLNADKAIQSILRSSVNSFNLSSRFPNSHPTNQKPQNTFKIQKTEQSGCSIRQVRKTHNTFLQTLNKLEHLYEDCDEQDPHEGAQDENNSNSSVVFQHKKQPHSDPSEVQSQEKSEQQQIEQNQQLQMKLVNQQPQHTMEQPIATESHQRIHKISRTSISTPKHRNRIRPTHIQSQEQVVLIPKQTYQYELRNNSRRKTRPQDSNKLNIIESYLRTTIHVLSTKFRTARSTQLEYYWDFDGFGVWLTFEQAKEEGFTLYSTKTSQNTTAFFALNGIQLNNLNVVSSCFLRKFRGIFKNMLLQKIELFEAKRRAVIRMIQASKSKVIEKRAVRSTRLNTRRQPNFEESEDEDNESLEKQVKRINKLLQSKKKNNPIINIIVQPSKPSTNKNYQSIHQTEDFDNMSLSRAYTQKRRLQSWIKSHENVKRETNTPSFSFESDP